MSVVIQMSESVIEVRALKTSSLIIGTRGARLDTEVPTYADTPGGGGAGWLAYDLYY